MEVGRPRGGAAGREKIMAGHVGAMVGCMFVETVFPSSPSCAGYLHAIHFLLGIGAGRAMWCWALSPRTWRSWCPLGSQ